MPLFDCRIAKTDGSIAEERVEAEDEKAVRVQLEEKGYLIFSIRRLQSLSLSSLGWGFRKRIHPREFLVFNQELLALIRAGISIMRILDILIGRASHPAFQAALVGVRDGVRGGLSISEAMAKYPSYFAGLYVSSVRAGERSGNLVEILQRHIVYLKRMLAVRKKVISALSYPIFLLVVGISVIFFLLTYVMPTFMEIFKDSETQLPLATQRLIFVVGFLQNYFLYLLLGMVVIIVFIYQSYQTSWGKQWLDSFILKIPIIGQVMERHYMITLSRTLSTTLSGGISLVPALGMVAEALPNQVWSKKVQEVSGRVQEGVSLAQSLAQSEAFPKMSLEMIDVGENSGSLVEMLGEVADFHEDELDLYLGRVTTWVEPVMLLVMGIIVAMIVISMYLPIFHLAGTVK
ncbi:MAG: type II secretion system F family protein [Nitrospira sp.]|nr:type II secretion system F family protein [Nitrospira sp.]